MAEWKAARPSTAAALSVKRLTGSILVLETVAARYQAIRDSGVTDITAPR
jgi:hypothetical protein